MGSTFRTAIYVGAFRINRCRCYDLRIVDRIGKLDHRPMCEKAVGLALQGVGF